jgi:hypothetical protein
MSTTNNKNPKNDESASNILTPKMPTKRGRMLPPISPATMMKEDRLMTEEKSKTDNIITFEDMMKKKIEEK